MKKLFWILIGLGLGFTGVAYAAVSGPNAQQKGDLLTGLTTGNYQLFHPGTSGYCLKASSTSASGLAWDSCAAGGAGTVTSVDATVPTGLSVSGVPITGAGTIAISLQAGYNIPLTASTTNWNDFYNTPSTRITAGTNLSWSGNTLNGTMASSTIIAGGTATHSPSITFATTTDTNLLLSIFCNTATCTFTPGWTGTLADGRIASAATWNAKQNALTFPLAVNLGGTGSTSLNTTLVSEGTNLYYTDARARGSVSASASPITYDSSSGKIGFTNPGYITGNQTITFSGDISGSGTTAITTSYNGIVPISKGGTATSTAPSASAVLLGNGTNYDYSVIPSCSNTTTSKLLYNNTTRTFSCGTDQTGSGGGATTTITSNVQTDGPNFIFATGTATGIGLNISGSGSTVTFTPTVSANYSIPLTASTTEWATALLTKLSTTTAASTYEPILTKGNLTATAPLQFDNTRQVIGGAAALSLAAGYNIPLTASTTNWNTAYGWGNHAGLYPTFSYGSSSYATLWNLQAGSNMTISTSSGVSLAVSATPSFTKVTTTNASTTNLSIATDTYLTNVANCTNGVITGAGGKIACNGSAFLTSFTESDPVVKALTGIITSNGSAISSITDSSANWNTAYTDRLKWDGGSTGLTAATGRTSLGLGTMALEANTGSTTITTLGTIGTGTWNGTTIAIGNGGTGQTTATLAFNALDPMTTKGDIITHNGTDSVRLAVGTDNYVLTASSTAANGLAWKAAPPASLSGGTAGFAPYWTSASAIGVGKLMDNGTVIGMNATSSTIGFNIQGTAGTNAIANFASSTGTSVLQITAGSQVLIDTAARLTIPQGTAPTLSAAGDIGIDTSNGGLFSFYANGRENLNATTTKAFFIASPTASESYKTVPNYSFDVPVTITKVRCLITSNSNSPSWTFSLPHSTALGTASANAMTAGQACTATTTPQTITIGGDLTLAAGEVIWATSSAVSNASTTQIYIDFKYDN
jgi:hypothetical protein